MCKVDFCLIIIHINLTTMTWEDAIESYKTYLILEKSLSSNSVEAYLNDIKKLAKYCS